jgi:hypothetical protein
MSDSIADIRKDGNDVMGDKIEAIYSKVSNVYAVYLTENRVKIQFADDPELMYEQRRALSPMTPLRGEIDSLLDKWRKKPAYAASVGIFDRRTADALAVALQGDQAHAETLLRAVREDILEEQRSIGRVAYLVIAACCALAVFLAFALLATAKASGTLDNTISAFIAYNKVWLAASIGSLGALFSIFIGIRKRELKPDMQFRDNVVDAILRILIGAVSAVVLFSLLRSQLLALAFGADRVEFGTGSAAEMHVAIVVAFVAGFTEMLVGNYLARAVLRDNEADASVRAAQQEARQETEANEHNPRGRREVEAGRRLARPRQAPATGASLRVGARGLNGAAARGANGGAPRG